MIAFGLARLGRDTELRRIADGTAVANLSLAFTYGRKGADGKRPTQWVEAAIFGKRAEAVVQYLTKGSLVSVTLEEVHIETFEKSDGSTGTKLAARVLALDLAGSPKEAEAPPPPPPPKPKPAAPTSFDDMDSDVPF